MHEGDDNSSNHSYNDELAGGGATKSGDRQSPKPRGKEVLPLREHDLCRTEGQGYTPNTIMETAWLVSKETVVLHNSNTELANLAEGVQDSNLLLCYEWEGSQRNNFQEGSTVAHTLFAVDLKWALDASKAKPIYNVEECNRLAIRYDVTGLEAYVRKLIAPEGDCDVDRAYSCKEGKIPLKQIEEAYADNDNVSSKEVLVVNDSQQQGEILGNGAFNCAVAGIGGDRGTVGAPVIDDELGYLEQEGNIALINVEALDPANFVTTFPQWRGESSKVKGKRKMK